MEKFDLLIIGGGAGGFGAAIRANELGAKTAMVNSGLPVGGTCVNVGCVPSKTLLYAGEVLHLAKHHGVPGIELDIKKFDFKKVVQDEISLVETLRKEKYEKVLQSLPGVTFYEGKARFVSKNEMVVNRQTLHSERFVIAAGSTATVPPIDGISETGFVTHIEALRLSEQPKDLIIIGAGPLGLEFAQMYARFGTKVTLLKRSVPLLPISEEELAEQLVRIFEQEEITVKRGLEFRSARKENGEKVITYLLDGKEEQVSADEILLAAGKTPNTSGIGLDNAGVETDKRAAIIVNEFLQTSQPHIFAAGDVAVLPLRLEITAAHEGTLAAENALTGSQKGIDYDTVPFTVFTDPQFAGVGPTEEELIKRLGACSCRTLSFESVPKGIITRRTEGLIKMVIHPETRRIHGVHILSPYAGELIAEAMMLVRNKNTIDDVVDSLPMFPTLSEAIKLVALSFTKDISGLSCCI